MGIINSGANGPFRGKAGSVIGSAWKKTNYIKGHPKPYSNKGNPSAAQFLQQRKFKMLITFFTPLSSALEIGFASLLSRSSARNAAFRYNYDQAFDSDTDGNPKLNYAAIQLSHGSLLSPGRERAIWVAEGLEVSWNTKTYGLNGSLDDEVHVITYSEQNNTFVSDEATPLRYQGKTLVRKEFMAAGTIHIWLFLYDRQAKRASPTTYLSIQLD